MLAVWAVIMSDVDAKKKKKKSKGAKKVKELKPESYERPKSIEPIPYCSGCVYSFNVIMQQLRGSRKEYDIADAMSKQCEFNN